MRALCRRPGGMPVERQLQRELKIACQVSAASLVTKATLPESGWPFFADIMADLSQIFFQALRNIIVNPRQIAGNFNIRCD